MKNISYERRDSFFRNSCDSLTTSQNSSVMINHPTTVTDNIVKDIITVVAGMLIGGAATTRNSTKEMVVFRLKHVLECQRVKQ